MTKVMWNNSNKWLYIATYSLKPQAMIPMELIEESKTWKNIFESWPELEIISVLEVDNTEKALKKRLKQFKRRC